MKSSAVVIGLDIAAHSFFAVGVDVRRREVLKRKLSRSQVLKFFAQHPPAAIGIEACPGAHYWARELGALGHEVRLIAAQHVSRRVVANKNDYRDAQVICELRGDPNRHFVAVNTQAQQDLQMLHRIRAQVVSRRKALMLQTRGLLGEYGVVFNRGVSALRKGLVEVLGGMHLELSPGALESFTDLYEQWRYLDEKLALYDARIERHTQSDPIARRLMTLPGVGPLTATAALAALGSGESFNNARAFPANLGLTPREFSTGGKQRLFGLSKRGDRYLRTLFIHGARSALRCAEGKPDRLLKWALRLKESKGFNVAACALANKLARLAWVLVRRGETYLPGGPARPALR